jgi:hypothetical protein
MGGGQQERVRVSHARTATITPTAPAPIEDWGRVRDAREKNNITSTVIEGEEPHTKYIE